MEHYIGDDIGDYKSMYLWILVPKMKAVNIERIASCLWSTVKRVVLPLNASKLECVEMATGMWAANEIASDD